MWRFWKCFRTCFYAVEEANFSELLFSGVGPIDKNKSLLLHLDQEFIGEDTLEFA